MPTYREGTPKALIDACAMGLPIVTTKIPGCKLVVKSGYNGYKVPVKNINQLINKLEILIKSRAIRQKFSKISEGRIRAENPALAKIKWKNTGKKKKQEKPRKN